MIEIFRDNIIYDISIIEILGDSKYNNFSKRYVRFNEQNMINLLFN